MWTCSKCGEKVDDQFDSCWKCSTPKSGAPSKVANAEAEAPKWRIAYRKFRGTFATWDDLFTEATAFANEMGPDRVVNISHSADRGDGVVVVWYLTNEEDTEQA